MLERLKERVWRANCLLPEYGLVCFTWGNVSGIDRASGLVVIKPSGVPYAELSAEKMVVTDLAGRIVEGDYSPSSDLATHLELYKAFETLGGVVHTHSRQATAFAQAGRSIPPYGTTHADYFHGAVPCTRPLTAEEIGGEYERNTGLVIIEAFAALSPEEIPGVLVANHGVFAWGEDPETAVHNAAVIEEVAAMAALTEQLDPSARPAPQYLMDKHYFRKHGANAYYGQKVKKL